MSEMWLKKSLEILKKRMKGGEKIKMKLWDKNKLKKLGFFDVGLVKLASMAFILFVITIWPAAMTWVHSVSPWIFLALMALFGALPFYKVYVKK